MKKMKGMKNKLNDIESAVTAKINVGKAHLSTPHKKLPNKSNLHTSSKKNFDHIFNSMN
jgi:hypothetical protein